ncbi:hypothetical protein F5Y12DRAFT_326629 [Xylaria sp. FL1777]|nr:hypothetical protein F5Y12DRAFT_326629 [Xylaria sp. FL1777]
MSRHAQVQEDQEDEQASRPSRYRSLRKQPVSAPAPPDTRRTASGNREPDQQHENPAVSSVSRSMSRYRRRATSVGASMDNDAAQTMNSALVTPPVPAIPLLLKTTNPPNTTGGQTELMHESSAPRQLRRTIPRRTTGPSVDSRDNHSNITHDDSRDQIAGSSRNIQHRSPEQRDVSWEVERNRLLEEQKMKDLQRLEEELEKSQKAKAQSHKFKTPVVDRFMLLAKGNKNSKDGASLTSPTTTSTKPSTWRSGHEQPTRHQPAHIEPGGKGIVPQKDAPTSAINAGNRNVAVRCRHQTYSLSVTPDTTTADIISQTSSKVGYDLDMSSEKCLVIEQYGILGLERRLRRYERIRDVMNSWDGDEQNRLAVTLSDPRDNNEDLEVSAVVNREESPMGCQLQMYHSNRPGKWNKKWITLLESGQIICAKKPNAKSTDKDTANLCHLSDYDIYTPTESQMRRHIKPPKRFCYAIKSQHKTTIFLNTDNYVQYFSTDDPHVAREFRQRAHSWRSWYLVDRRPEIFKSQISPVAKPEERSLQPAPGNPTIKQPDNVASLDEHRLRVSMDESPYAIGQFEPLLDMKRFDKRLSQFGRDSLPPESDPPKQKLDQGISRRLSKREKPDHKLHQPSKRESREGFTGGLLGEEYDNRKQALADLEKKKRPPELAFTEGPSLLSSRQDHEPSTGQPESPSWFPSALEHTAKQRTVPPSTAARSTASGGVERRFSLTSTTNQPSGFASSATRPSTQHRSQHPYTQPHPNPLGSQPTTLSHSDRRVPPKPLVDLTPTIQEPPQWSKEKKGHGVRPPDDIGHLIDFISVGNGIDGRSNDYLQPPPRTTPRRPPTSGSLGRSRTMTSASPGRPLHDAPPVPLLPSRYDREIEGSGRRLANAPVAHDGRVDRRETIKHKEREQEKGRLREREREQRDYREREAAYNAVPGRTGTLKVV